MTPLRSLRFAGPGQVELCTGERRDPGPGQVGLRTTRSLISPGSEVVLYEGTHSDIVAGRRKYPTSGGYSCTGVIERLGAGVTEYAVGQRVLAHAGHASHGNLPLTEVLPIPDGVADDNAVFGILGSIVLHGLREAAPQFGENVLVMGLGAIGQIAVRLLRLTPVGLLIGADRETLRLEHGRAGGADAVLDVCAADFAEQVLRLTGGRGGEIAIEASGNPAAVIQAIEVLAPRGRLVILGCPHGEAPLDLYTRFQKRELTIVGSYQPQCPDAETPYTPWTKRRNRALVLEYLRQGRVEFASLITHRARCADATALYETLSRHKGQALCGIFDWD